MREVGWGYLIGCVGCLFSFLLFASFLVLLFPLRSRPTNPPFNQPTKQNANQTHRLLADPDEAVQEQAFAILRNLTESEEGIEMVFTEVGPKVLDAIAATLGGSACPCDDVVLQVGHPFYFPPPINHPSHSLPLPTRPHTPSATSPTPPPKLPNPSS